MTAAKKGRSETPSRASTDTPWITATPGPESRADIDGPEPAAKVARHLPASCSKMIDTFAAA